MQDTVRRPARDLRVATVPEVLTVIGRDDPVLAERGYRHDSRYVELFWLPVLGPSATWLCRLIERTLDTQPEGVSLDAQQVSTQLGLGELHKAHNPFVRTVNRLVAFGVAAWHSDDTLAFNRKAYPLPTRRVSRLPAATAQLWEMIEAGAVSI